jgi:hypothetical protein
MKKSILFFLLLGISLIISCEIQEDVPTETNPTTTIYNTQIADYFSNLKATSNLSKENSKKINSLIEAIDYSSIKTFELKNTVKLVVADLKNFTSFPETDHNKTIFLVLNNTIIRSNIVTIKNKEPFDDVNQVIASIFDMKKNKENYSGTINFYNLLQSIILSNEFEKGILKVNGVRHRSPNSSLTAKSNGCIAWYWLTTYFDGTQTKEYMFTSCDCEELMYRGDCGGGGGAGGGGSSSSNNNSAGPNYPDNPKNGEYYTYVDYDGEVVTRQYDMKTKTWKIVSIKLSEVVVNNNREKYSFLILPWPRHGQTVISNNFIYTFDGSSWNWDGEPATEEAIAQAIEDQIDDSKLDPCTKGVLDKIKNLSGGDITKMLNRFSPAGSIFKINMITGKVINNDPNVWAQTTPIKGSRTDINMVFNENYIYGTNYSSRPTDLSVATTMAHEVIHAYLISLLEENKACGASGICDFPTIYDAYVQQQISNNTNPNLTADEHHELIAKNYVFTIASTIQEFHTGQSAPYPYQVYIDLAWGGLIGTYVFNKDYPNDPNDKNYKYRERILDRINTEKKGGQYQGYFPIGTPCKK